MDEQPVLPACRVVRGELVVGADERAEALVLGERLEGDAVGRALDLDPALGDDGDAGHVDVEHRVSGDCPRPWPFWPKRVRVEAATGP